MKLTRLHLIGFKSFAERTEIELGDGLTAIVGPNGCGKSNVADALLWVMGEQSARTLRGLDTRDVIFAGTDRRKPLGMAEVRLTVDNSDNTLPIPFAEVTVARRVYRSGDSQYLLNGAQCRLKDIVELFMDTGLGRDAYSFVGQSEVDAVLSARPEDRRELFEEAAGIKKYRARKREAVRKLEQAEANLTRVRDIVNELERQRAPLEAQADVARRYLALTERLQQIEVGLLVAEVQKLDYELYAERREQELDRQSIQAMEADLARLEREAGAVGERLADAESELESARISHQAALTTVERTAGRRQLAVERGASAERTADALDAELRDLAEAAAGLQKQIAAGETALARAEEGETARRGDLGAARAALAEMEAALADAMRRSADGQGELRRLAEQRATRQGALEACRARAVEVAERAAGLERERDTVTAQAAEAQERVASCQAALEEQRCARDRHEARAAEAAAALAAARDTAARAQEALGAARRLLAERSSRLTALVEMQEAGEGFYQGVRALLRAHRDGKVPGSYTPVVDLLTVPEAYRVAVEVGLGGSMQDIVCDTEQEAKAAIGWLKAARAGRATFLALPLLRPSAPLGRQAARGLRGVVGVGPELVSADPRYAGVVQLLLGRVLVMEDLDSAIEASRRVQGWSRIVTLEGEQITPGGALTGGSLQGRGAHLVGRKGEIDDLKRAMPNLQAEADRLQTAVAAAHDEGARHEAERADAARDRAEAEARAAASERDLHAATRERDRLAADAAAAVAEGSRLAEARRALAEEAARWEAAVAESQAEDLDVDGVVAAAAEEARGLTARVDAARAEAVELEVAAGRLTEKRIALRRTLAADQDALARARASHAARQEQRERASQTLAQALGEQSDLAAAAAEAEAACERCRQYLEACQERRKTLLDESFGKANAIKELGARRAELTAELHDAELKIARLEMRLAQAAQRLLEEYGIETADALARPEEGAIDRETTAEVVRLRREIRAMGQVNTGAAAEYDRLTERLEFLTEQKADLDKGRESLIATIAEIDASTRGSFMSTFDAVSQHFQGLFVRLFGGGSTRLALTNPDDLLETGIEVIAQPPGKRPQHLSLLSGGERALTAVALLFSLLAVRPSPFVLLDEVDAPLDGANVDRFVALVEEFSRDTQFLVITHNPATMEAAPRWYGVTMEEAGISRVLPYRMPPDASPNGAEG